MTPSTEIRLQFTIATVKLEPTDLVEADFKLPAGEFARLTHANDKAREGKLFVHKVEAMEMKKSGENSRGLLQSALFDTDKSDGRQELRELMDELKKTTVERLYAGDYKIATP